MTVENAVLPSPLPGPNCERCGRCLSVCPAYQVSRVETLSPRGRFEVLDALAAGRIAPSPRTAQSLAQCLQCRACADICGKGVDVAALVRDHRAAKPVSGLSAALADAGFGLVLGHRPVLAGLARVFGAVSRLLPSRGEPPVRHLPLALPQMLRGRAVPSVTGPGLFARLPERLPPAPGVRERGPAVFFAGCWQGALEPDAALAAVALLRAAGFTVLVPRDQTCCGFPALASGHADHAERLAGRNRQALVALPVGAPVFAACPSCRTGLALTDAAPGREILDPLLFLHAERAFAPADVRPGAETAVAVHEPCHARGSLAATVALLSQIPGVSAAPLESACCGGGGLSAYANPELSWSLGRSRAARAKASGATMAAAACPGCLLQLRGCLAEADAPVRTAHPLELLAKALPGGCP